MLVQMDWLSRVQVQLQCLLLVEELDPVQQFTVALITGIHLEAGAQQLMRMLLQILVISFQAGHKAHQDLQ